MENRKNIHLLVVIGKVLKYDNALSSLILNFILVYAILTNSMAYGTRRFNAAFTRALQKFLCLINSMVFLNRNMVCNAGSIPNGGEIYGW